MLVAWPNYGRPLRRALVRAREARLAAGETALDLMPPAGGIQRVLDVGTGSGAILLAILKERPNAFGIGTDISEAALFEAAHVMLHRVKKWSGLKVWATKVAQRQGNKRATVALARKMSITRPLAAEVLREISQQDQGRLGL